VTPKRAALLIGVPAVLAAVVFLFVLPALTGPRTDEERVRAVFAKIVKAVLAEDFEAEWDLLASPNRAYWEDQLGGWKELDPRDELWGDLRDAHGIEREALLPMSAGEFFAACRSGEARQDPEWWAKEREALRALPPGTFELEEDGSARLSFDVDTDPEIDIEIIVAEFLREDGEWRLWEIDTTRWRMRTVGWHEPALELPWAEGATASIDDGELGIIVNLLADGRLIVSEEEIDGDELRRRLASLPDPEKLRVFRCDRRVPWSDAAPWLGLLAGADAGPVALTVSHDSEGRCRPPRAAGEVGFQTCEPLLDYSPPAGLVDPAELSAVIDVGPEAIDGEGRAALAAADLLPGVLLNPSGDASWDAVVRVLAALDAAGVEGVLLADPNEESFGGGTRVSGQPAATHPAATRVLGK